MNREDMKLILAGVACLHGFNDYDEALRWAEGTLSSLIGHQLDKELVRWSDKKPMWQVEAEKKENP